METRKYVRRRIYELALENTERDSPGMEYGFFERRDRGREDGIKSDCGLKC